MTTNPTTNPTPDFANEAVTYLVLALQKTPLASKGIDLTTIQGKVTPIIDSVFKKLDTQDSSVILGFIKNQSLLSNCILPNIAKIMQDGQITIDDAPAFLSIMVGIFESVKDFIQENKTVSITSNDIIELSALTVKIIIAILVPEQGMVAFASSIIDSAVKLVKLVVKPKTFSCKFCCCKK